MDNLLNSTASVVALAAVFLSTCLYLFFTATFNYWKDRGVPYVKPLPLFGNVKDQVFNKRNFVDVVGDIYKNLEGHKFGGFFEMSKPVLIILDPELVEKVLVKDFTYFYDRGFPTDPEFDPLSGHLFTLEGDAWRNLRYKLTPAFTTGKLKGMFEQISNCGDSVIKYIEDGSESGKAVEIAPLMAKFSLDVIASCAFGLQIDEENEMNRQFCKAIMDVFKPSRIAVIKNAVSRCWPNIGKRLGFKSVPDNVEKLIMTIVKETIRFRENNNVNRNDFLQLMLNLRKQDTNAKSDSLPEKEHDADDDVIDQMRHARRKGDEDIKSNKKVVISDDLIAAQLFIFLGGGSETVSVTIGYCLYLLAQHPQIQHKVKEEIDSALQQADNNWSYKVIKELKYLEQVLQEAMRLYPISPVLFRECTQPYKLPGSSVILEKGTRVVIPVLSIQCDPRNYDSPEVFMPDRFVDNNFKSSGIYLPFGDGPRICIAMRFAILEMKVVLARIVSQYTVKLNGKTQLPIQFSPSNFLIAPLNGLWFNFYKRTKS